MTARIRYAPGQAVAERWPGWTVVDMTVDEAREVARHCPNRIEVEAVTGDDLDEFGTPPLPLGDPTCSECRAVIAWRPDDPPGTPCAACCADHLEGPAPWSGVGPSSSLQEDPWNTQTTR